MENTDSKSSKPNFPESTIPKKNLKNLSCFGENIKNIVVSPKLTYLKSLFNAQNRSSKVSPTKYLKKNFSNNQN